MSLDVDDYKAIVFRRSDDIKDFSGGDVYCGIMIVLESKDHHGGGRLDSAFWAPGFIRP
ncbi:MAG: hypothetical protein ABSB35_10715 [Bryobacteraceae bacterium]